MKNQRNGNEDVDELDTAACRDVSGDNLMVFEDHVPEVKSKPDKIKYSSIW